MRMSRALVTVAVAVAALLPGTAASAATVTQALKIWTWNVAGQKLHGGATNDGLIAVLGNSIRNRGSDLAAVNELCWSQYKAIQANLRASGWPQDVENFSRFESTNDTGCSGEQYGIALFSRAPMGTANRVTLPDDGRAEHRKLLCAPLSARPHLRFCTTHITTAETANVAQLNAVRAQLEAWNAAGDTVVIAGDFNAQPNYARLNNWYAPSVGTANNAGNSGFYRELDDTDPRCVGYGENTEDADPPGPCGPGKKIDLIFARESRIVGAYEGDSLSISEACGGPCSDHRIVVGAVTVSVTT